MDKKVTFNKSLTRLFYDLRKDKSGETCKISLKEINPDNWVKAE